MNFRIGKKLENGLGRAGEIETVHGTIETPAFVAVGTKATVKALTPEQLKEIGAQVVLGNTYHLYLQPGDEIVKKAGGLGKFMNWSGPTMTDSGGFQVFSLGAAYGKGISKVDRINGRRVSPSACEIPCDETFPTLVKIQEDGVSFKSHLDGSTHHFTPEKSIQIQHNLGADIIFAFDECTSPTEDLKYQKEALERTHRWAERSLAEHLKLCYEEKASFAGSLSPHARGALPLGPSACETPRNRTFSSSPALFGIVQGGRDENLRKESAQVISSLNFDGFGIGGSFTKKDISKAVKWVNEILPEEKPRHLLGIGEPEDLLMGIENGVDLFDCVAPTRMGRNGTLYTNRGKIIITNAKYRNDFGPVEKGCGCYVCSAQKDSLTGSLSAPVGAALPLGPSACETPRSRTFCASRYSRAYLAHLFRSKEILAATLASIHNLTFIVRLVQGARQAILDGKYSQFKQKFLAKYHS
jgi:queuine tRNA-ribosyltransferase